MSFLIALLIVIAERAAWNLDAHRNRDWLQSLDTRLQNISALKKVLATPYGQLALLVGLPVALVFVIQLTLDDAWLLEIPFYAAALWFALGPTDLGREIESLLNKQRSHSENGRGDFRPIMQRAFIGANDALFAPLFWFALLGPVGAFAYRWYANWMEDNAGDNPLFATAWTYINWIPVRLTLLCFAIAGNFDAVAAAWKNSESNETDNTGATEILASAGIAALEQAAPRSHSELDVEDAMALVWRSLTLWMVLYALISLID
jgi:membrane protein required for beta-lactamase induction